MILPKTKFRLELVFPPIQTYIVPVLLQSFITLIPTWHCSTFKCETFVSFRTDPGLQQFLYVDDALKPQFHNHEILHSCSCLLDNDRSGQIPFFCQSAAFNMYRSQVFLHNCIALKLTKSRSLKDFPLNN